MGKASALEWCGPLAEEGAFTAPAGGDGVGFAWALGGTIDSSCTPSQCPDLEACKNFCEAQPLCIGFDFNPYGGVYGNGGYRCWMKRGTGELEDASITGTFVWYVAEGYHWLGVANNRTTLPTICPTPATTTTTTTSATTTTSGGGAGPEVKG